jgi:histidyl-tRNA synthetase
MFDGVNFEFTPTLARGLNYYTSTIFEIEIDGYSVGSVCGGGRYDDLIGMFAGRKIPAVGFAFGFDRILEAMESLQLFPPNLAVSPTKVLVTIFSEELQNDSLNLVKQLRNNEITAEIYLGNKGTKIEKQLKYANAKQIPYVVILGPEESKKNVITLRNMLTREQQEKSLPEIIQELEK